MDAKASTSPVRLSNVTNVFLAIDAIVLGPVSCAFRRLHRSDAKHATFRLLSEHVPSPWKISSTIFVCSDESVSMRTIRNAAV